MKQQTHKIDMLEKLTIVPHKSPLVIVWFVMILLMSVPLRVSSQEISVMTYNIRLDWGTDENRWENRKELLTNQLHFYAPDVLGIQEGLPHQVDHLDSALAAYSYIGVGREDGNNKGEYSAIFYQNEKLELVNSATFWLSPTPDKVSVGWDAALPRICTYGEFKLEQSGQRLMVFNTHFDHMGKQARVESMKLILEKIQQLNEDQLPIILMGDLNVTPDEQPITEMTKVLQDSRKVADLIHGPGATFNGFDFGKAPERRIDYIALSDDIKVLKHATLTDSFDQRYISDHFAVYCEVVLE